MNNLILPTRTSESINNNFPPILIRNQSVDSFFKDNDRRGRIYENDLLMHDNTFEGQSGLYNEPFDGRRNYENSQIQLMQINQSNSYLPFLPRWHKPMWPWLIFLPLTFLFLEVFNYSLIFILIKIHLLKRD
jgi:hypothetical protein